MPALLEMEGLVKTYRGVRAWTIRGPIGCEDLKVDFDSIYLLRAAYVGSIVAGFHRAAVAAAIVAAAYVAYIWGHLCSSNNYDDPANVWYGLNANGRQVPGVAIPLQVCQWS